MEAPDKSANRRLLVVAKQAMLKLARQNALLTTCADLKALLESSPIHEKFGPAPSGGLAARKAH